MAEATEQARLIEEEAAGGEAGRLLLTGVAGLMVGAMAGLMLAPDCGAEVRRRVRESIVTCCSTCRDRLRPLVRCVCRGEAEEEA
jgi:hypothetical protein